MRTTYWKPGDWSAICDVCGKKYKASELSQRWDGLQVCEEDWEMRHPQELIRPIPDQQKLPWTRPEATDTFTDVTGICTAQAQNAIPDLGIPDCVIPDTSIIVGS